MLLCFPPATNAPNENPGRRWGLLSRRLSRWTVAARVLRAFLMIRNTARHQPQCGYRESTPNKFIRHACERTGSKPRSLLLPSYCVLLQVVQEHSFLFQVPLKVYKSIRYSPAIRLYPSTGQTLHFRTQLFCTGHHCAKSGDLHSILE